MASTYALSFKNSASGWTAASQIMLSASQQCPPPAQAWPCLDTMCPVCPLQKHIQAHGRCRPEWAPWVARNGEGPEQHQARLKQKFTFKR